MKRFIPLLVLAAAIVCLIVWWPHVRNESFVIFGNRDEAGGWYGFWSGWAGGVRILEWPVIVGLVYWHHSCSHSPWCLRLGKYQAAGGTFKLCHHHHPDLQGTRPHGEMIRAQHEAWKRRHA